MAWLDDRAWCHPKLVELTDRAFRCHINAIAYSSGMGTSGKLTLNCQRLVGADKRIREQLIRVGLWDIDALGQVFIHDWDEHNGKRDLRRKRDRQRKKIERMSNGQSNGQVVDETVDAVEFVRSVSSPSSTGTARVEGSEGSEGSEGAKKKKLRSRPSPLPEHKVVVAAICSVFGTPSNDPEWGRYAKSAKALRQSLVDTDPEEFSYEIEWRKRALEASWGKPCSPLALASNWSQAVVVSTFVAPPDPHKRQQGALTLSSNWEDSMEEASALLAQRNGHHAVEAEILEELNG